MSIQLAHKYVHLKTKDNILTIEAALKRIPGLKYIHDCITEDQHDELLKIIDKQIWMENLKRRVQHYGYKYDYKKRSLDTSMYLGDLPDWTLKIAKNLYESKLLEQLPDQVIINEYLPGQGIADHVDCPQCFSKTIISLSLGSPCIMNFTNAKTLERIPILLYPKSLIILKGEARYEWKHGIPPRKTDNYEGNKFFRTRRVSMTFRNVVIVENTTF